MDIVIENTGVEELGRSRFHALQLLLRPSRLYLSYRAAKSPSVCVKQLKEMFSITVSSAGEMLTSLYAPEDRIPTRRVAENLLTEYSRQEREGLLSAEEAAFARSLASLLGATFPLPSYEVVPETVREKCFFREKVTSISELESYYKCPFEHFVRYGLRARERDVAEKDRADLGTFVHTCLLEFMSSPTYRALSEEETKAEARRIAESILQETSYQSFMQGEDKQAPERYIKTAVAAISLASKQVKSSSFVPTYFEATFGEGGRIPPVKIGDVRLAGKIDRIDVLDGKDVCVVDYKTGDHKFKTSQLYYGTKIQSHLYLVALANMGYRPVAAMYADVSGNVKLTECPYMIGQILEDRAIVSAFDATFEDGKSIYTGIKANKDGSVRKTKGKTITEAQLQAMMTYAVRVAETAIKEIEEGYIAPSPEPSHCTYCKAKNICHYADVFARNGSGEIAVADIERIVSGGEDVNGRAE